MRKLLPCAVVSLAFGCGGSTPAAAAPSAQAPPILLTVDARGAALSRLKSRLVVPAHPGELALVYPKWVPGEHGPNGPIADVVGLKVSAGGKPAPWHRNPDDMYEIDVDVPAGATSVEIEFDLIRSSSGPFGGSAAATSRFVDVVWNQALFYPRGARAAAVEVAPTVLLPPGWSYATALSGGVVRDGAIAFPRVSLEMLVDSPLLAGAHLKTYDLGVARGAAHALSVVGENDADVVAPPEEIAAWKRLVAEATALFGARHYDAYHFLLVASDDVPGFGLEHHQSSEDYVKERALTDGDLRRITAGLLPHEFVHSWNGKYRRPRGLATPSYQEPMRGDLLWVYEGLTEYLGWVLATRSGLASLDDAKAELALAADDVDRAGRLWRPLADTTAAAQLLYRAPRAFSSERRGVDFYSEGLLVWLEADVLIRQKTNGARSLDDFCQRFHGKKDGPPEVKPYDLDEVVRTLNEVAPNDWHAFFDARIYKVAPKIPTGGIESAGYALAYTEKKPELVGLYEKAYKYSSYVDSLGFQLDEENVAGDVHGGSPAARAGLLPRSKVLAVDGRKWSSELATEALLRAKTTAAPIEILVEADGFYRTLKVDYRAGERYRTITRDPTKPDLLGAILAPRVK